MKTWVYVFHFICEACQRVTVGKRVFVGGLQHEMLPKVKARGFVCEYCGETANSELVAGAILEAPQGEIKATPDIIM